jgi:LuxR family transcriptional regulator, quorum-sensing system regulator BjaR1
MQVMDAYWGRRALEFVDAIEASKTSANVLTQFEKMIHDLGFHAYIMAGVPAAGQSLQQTILANGWPQEWFDMYAREQFHHCDPIPRHCLSTLNPFAWSEVPYDCEDEPGAHAVMTRAKDFRLNEGFCVPIHYDDAVGAVSLAGENPNLAPDARGALHLISIFTHSRLRALARSTVSNQSRRLSRIEAEVLSWAARGKTAWETSRILGVSERNVRWHLEEAQRKLSTKNKTATVATALVNGEISI